MKTTIASALFFTLFGAHAQTGNQLQFAKAKEIINDRIANYQVPSVAVAVVKDGKIIWEEAFGYADREKKIKATIHTPYYLASISKTITATAVMNLYEDRKLDINRSVNQYLKGGKVNSTKWDPNLATVKMVMSHTSGLTTFNFWCVGEAHDCAKRDDEVFNRYAILTFEPGSKFDYSNLGYGVLDHVVTNASGMPFGDYLMKDIFQPLGMSNSFLAYDPLPSTVAIQYAGHDASRIEYPVSHLFTGGASNIYSSAHDLALFAMQHLNNTKQPVLNKESVDMMKDTKASGTPEYGFGWWVNNDYYGYKGFLAQGGTWTAHTRMQLIPSENMAVIVLTNIGHSDPWSTVVNEIFAELLPTFKTNFTAPPKPKNDATPTPQPNPPSSKWAGFVRTHKGDIPLEFNYNGAENSFAQIGNEKFPAQKIVMSLNFVSFVFESDLKIEDAPGPYNLNFYLTRDDKDLYGHMETRASKNPATPTLPLWVEMKKVE